MNEDRSKTKDWISFMRKELTVKKDLIPLKLILFLYNGGQTAFLPYLTLHMQQLGITVKEIAIIYAFMPIASLLGPPTSGLIADKFGNYKRVSLINMVLSMFFHICLLYVPSRTSNSLALNCGPQGYDLTWADCNSCHQNLNNTELDLVVTNCEYACKTPPAEIHLCLHDTFNTTSCHAVSIGNEIRISGTLTSQEEDGICSNKWSRIIQENQTFQNLTCPSPCPIECQVSGVPNCPYLDHPSNAQITFWLYFALRLIATFFLASAFTMVDAVSLAIIKEHKSDFGKQRFFALVGIALAPLVSGAIVDRHSANIGYSDYMPALYLGAGLVLLSIILIARIEVKVDIAGENLFRDLKKLVTKLEIDIFLVMILIQGSSWGFIESYLFVYLRELNAPNYLLGLTMTVGCLVGAPVMLIADRVIDKLGRPVVFIISFFAYAVRHFGYSFMINPWTVFPYEILEIFTYQIMWLAALTYCPILAPKGLLATMTGLAGSTHYSLGRGVGSLLGGYLITNWGTAAAFRVYGFIALGGGVAYTVLHFCYLKKKLAENELKSQKEDPEEKSEEEESMLDKKPEATNGLNGHSAVESSL